jgi:hypothetical protein
MSDHGLRPAPKPPKRVQVSRKTLKRRTRVKRFNKKRQGHAFPKNVDESYRQWIRLLPCLLRGRTGCPVGDWGVIDAAHVKTRGSGGKDRANLVPLCHYHHMEQHDLGIPSFERKYEVSLRTSARQLTEVYEAENFPCP